MFDIEKTLRGHVSRLRYVQRFSTCRVAYPESVAEHSYYVTLYTWLICLWVQERWKNKYPLRVYVALSRALVHDLEESRSGDVPRPFKHSTPELFKMLNNAATAAMHDIANEVFYSERLRHEMFQTWRDAKINDIEGRIVAFADFLSCVSYLLQENRDHNEGILEHAVTVHKYMCEFDGPDYDFMRSLVKDTASLVREMFNEQ